MARILRITAFTGFFFILFGMIGAALILYTPPGRTFILEQAEAMLAEELGGEADITAIRGRLPGYVIIDNLVLTENGSPWARIDRAELRWKPLRLIFGNVVIDSLLIDGGAIMHEPPNNPDEYEPFSIVVPEELPSLRIAEMQINNLQSSLGGVSARVDGVGAVDMGGKRINARVNLTSAGDADTIDIAVNISPRAERVFIDATIASQENGIVASIADLGGPLFLAINADSPTDSAQITLSAQLGAYGNVSAELLANLTHIAAIEADGRFTAGPQLAEIEELAEPLEFKFTLKDEVRGGRITIDRLLSAAGALAGDISWHGLRDNDNNLTADLRMTLAEAYRPELQDILGRDVTLGVELKRRPGDYAVNLRLRGSGGVDAIIEDGVTDLRKVIAGNIRATLQPRDETLMETAHLATRFAADLDDAVSLRAIDFVLGDGFRAQGRADFAFADNAIQFDGDIDAAPAFVEKLAPSVSPQGRITANINANGAAELFTLIATVETPDIKIGENTAPAFIGDIALAGLPNLPTGEIKATAKDGEGAFAATLRSSQSGRIAAPAISYSGSDFNFEGAGAYTPETQHVEIDLTYKGGENAAPWPGVNIAGAFSASGQFAREGQRTDLTVAADDLRINKTRIAGLALRAAGPPSAVGVAASADQLLLGGGEPIADVKFDATLDARDDVTIRLTGLNAAYADNVARLLEPGVITVADGIALDNIRLGWSQYGRIAIDGAFSDIRWRGDFSLTDVNIPETDGRATLHLALDTDAAEMARGDFRLTSLISDAEASIKGNIAWDGAALVLSSLPDTDALDMRLALPARLTRTPALAVSTAGEVDGYVRYDGAIEPFTAFMPPELQTLEGFLTVNFDIAGTAENPSLAGVAEITDGAYTELRSGLSIAGLHTRADANVSPDGSTISFSGGARGGEQTGDDTIVIGGQMTLADISRIDLDINLNNAVLSAHPVNTARADGAVKIAGPLDSVSATGNITVHELDAEIVTPETTGLVPIEVVNIDEIEDSASRQPSRKASTVTYDIEIKADDRVFVRGRGIDSEWSADVRAVTIRNEPVVLGAMRLRRGTMDFSGRRFEITQGVITFDRLSPNNPLLDIVAEFETSEGVTATIEISGRAKEPDIELNSTPDLPDEDIMALVLFGKPADELTAFESLQTAQALASLGGIGPFGGTGVTGSIRRATGLDMLNLDIDPETGGGSLTVGKYVAEGLFISATQDAQGKGGAVIVEYEITDNISVETEVRQDGDQTVSANWKKDF